MKVLSFCGLLLIANGAWSGGSPYFSSEDFDFDSSEFGGPPGKKETTCQCGWTNKPDRRVVGGDDSGMHEYPFVVAVVDRMRNQFCGGSIVTPNHVITAAHCTIRYVRMEGLISVAVGEHDLTTDDETYHTQVIQVKKIIQHEDYDNEMVKNDISLLVLRKPIKFSKHVGPVCLPKGKHNIEKEYVKLVGWGRTSDGGIGSEVLQKVTLRVVPLEKCAELYDGYVDPSERTQICTHRLNKGSCQGDSGGPLVWLDPETNRYTLSGIVSFGSICASLEPSVYTDVSAYLDWIHKNIADSSEGLNLRICTKK